DRNIFGFNAQINKTKALSFADLKTTTGVGLRHDRVSDIELSHTLNRKTTLENIQLGDLNQTNMFAFYKAEFDLGKFKITPGLRLEYFKFMYNDALAETYTT